MGSFQYEWWTVVMIQATGRYTVEVKAKSRAGAIKQIEKMAKEHDDFVRVVRPDFSTEVLWDTLTLDRKGYQRLF